MLRYPYYILISCTDCFTSRAHRTRVSFVQNAQGRHRIVYLGSPAESHPIVRKPKKVTKYCRFCPSTKTTQIF